jgi:hypothetical protein
MPVYQLFAFFNCQTQENNEEPVEISSYLKDLFESYYSEFILNFGGMEEMMQGLGD